MKYDPKPLPSDGPDYHTELAAWNERMVLRTNQGKHYDCYVSILDGNSISVGDHAAVWYNEWNKVVQCHACGFTFWGFMTTIDTHGSLAELVQGDGLQNR